MIILHDPETGCDGCPFQTDGFIGMCKLNLPYNGSVREPAPSWCALRQGAVTVSTPERVQEPSTDRRRKFR